MSLTLHTQHDRLKYSRYSSTARKRVSIETRATEAISYSQ